jgi:hypothetical protein
MGGESACPSDPFPTHKEDKGLFATGARHHLVVTETHADEDDSKNGETHKLDLLSSPRVDEEEGEVVSGDQTSNSKDDVSDGDVVEGLVVVHHGVGTLGVSSETDGRQDDRGVETETWNVSTLLGAWQRLTYRRKQCQERTNSRRHRRAP